MEQQDMATTAGDVLALRASQTDAVFARRAEELAARTAGEAQRDEVVEALVFALGRELYAFPAMQVHEVRPLGWLTLLPGTPALLAGLINVRGRIVPVIDLRPLLGIASDVETALSVVLVSYRSGDVGLLVTDRPTVRLVHIGALTEPPAGPLSGIDAGCVRGITPELLIVLDAERLLADPHLIVQYEILAKV
jgi:purine-binding chemotaxis protein CheW